MRQPTALLLSLSLSALGIACRGTAEEAAISSAGVTAPSTLPDRVQRIVKALDTAMYKCPERVWPSITETYRDRSQLLLASESTMQAFLWNDHGGPDVAPPATATLDAATLGAEWFAPFNVSTYAKVPTVGISLDWTQEINDQVVASGGVLWHDFAAILAFHEGFHFLSGQSDWPPIADSTRFAPYPEPWQPRYYQRMMRGVLRDAVSGVAGADLGAAAFWRSRTTTEWAADTARSRGTAVAEGSAQYAEIVSGALAERGCDVSDADLMSAMLAQLGSYVRLDSFDGDYESYELGVLSGLVLRQRQVSGWESRVASGTAPVDVALQSVAPTRQEDSTEIRATVEQAVGERNTEIGLEVDPLIEKMASVDHYRIALPTRWLAGSFSTNGFLSLTDQPGQPNVLLEFGGHHESPSGVAIEVSGLTIIEGTSPCSANDAYVLTVPKRAVTESGGTFTIASKTVTFANLPARVLVKDGLPWICPSGDTERAAPARGRYDHVERTPDGRYHGTARPR